MARRPLPIVDAEREKARSLAAGLGLSARPPSQRRRAGPSPSMVARHEREVTAMIDDRTTNWQAAGAVHLVALFRVLHRWCYGVDAAGLSGGLEYLGAASAAGAMVRDQFGGDAERAVAFIKWAWRREKETEEWRRANGRAGGVLGWRLLFCRDDRLVRFRIDQARRSDGKAK